MPLTLKPTDAPKMLQIEAALLQALRPFNNQQTEALLAAVSLVRIARKLLDSYDALTLETNLPSLVRHLQGDQTQPGELWVPPHFGSFGGNGRK
jgi:hypothetical protein